MALEAAVRADAGTALSTTQNKETGGSYSLSGIPPLTWVVESFFQDLRGETPTDWLRRLMAAAHREDGAGGLGDLFPDAAAHTLFLPATELEQLQRLGDLRASDRTAQYEAGVRDLRERLMARLAQSERPQRTGRELAALLRILVSATNAGKLADVPSMWELYLRDALTQNRDAALEWYDSSMKRSVTSQTVPVSVEIFSAASQRLLESSIDLFERLSNGLPASLVAKSRAAVAERLAQRAEQCSNDHKLAVQRYCDTFVENGLAKFGASSAAMEYAVPSKTFAKEIAAMEAEAVGDFKKLVVMYGSLAETPTKSLERGLEGLRREALDQNRMVLNDMLEEAASAAKAACDDELRAKYKTETGGKSTALTKTAMDGLIRDVTKRSSDVLSAEAGIAKNEPSFADKQASVTVSCQASFAEIEAENVRALMRLVKKAADREVEEIHRVFKARDLPEEESSLNSFAIAEVKKRRAVLVEEFAKFRDDFHNTDKVIREAFEEVAEEYRQDLVKRNVDEIRRLLRDPLKRALEFTQREAPAYWLRRSLRSRAREIAVEEIQKAGGGRATALSDNLIQKAIDKWMEEDKSQLVFASVSNVLNFLLGLIGLG